MKVVSLIAEEPPQAQWYQGHSGNVAISTIRSAIENSGQTLEPVRSVGDISKKLIFNLNDQKWDLVQIIGHGQEGVLFLEGYWTGRKHKKRPYGGIEYYVLNSSPNIYITLKKAIKPPTEVWLLGCRVGENPKDEWTLTNGGPTLLFALEQMWNTKVWASTGTITDKDFDPKTGIFVGPLVGVNTTQTERPPRQPGKVERTAMSSPLPRPQMKRFWLFVH